MFRCHVSNRNRPCYPRRGMGVGWGGGRTPTDLAAGVPLPILLILILFRTKAYRFLELFSDLDSSNPLSCLSILNYEQHSTRNIVTTDIYCVPNSEKGIWIFNSIIIVSCIRSFLKKPATYFYHLIYKKKEGTLP